MQTMLQFYLRNGTLCSENGYRYIANILYDKHNKKKDGSDKSKQYAGLDIATYWSVSLHHVTCPTNPSLDT